jgi:type II secretory pathway predicted ATPase ExeA
VEQLMKFEHYFEHLIREAEYIKNGLHDLMDNKEHQHAKKMFESAEKLTEHIKLKRNPLTIIDHTKRMIVVLEEMRRHGDQVMDYVHIDLFRDRLHQINIVLRKIEHY